MYSQPKRIEFLDSIRGLAALFVLLSHAAGVFQWPASYFAIIYGWHGWPVISILFNGKEAVAMFFILSGYVLAKPYVEVKTGLSTPRKIFLPTFYLRRFLRIWPPWFVVFVISIFAKQFLFFNPATQPPTTKWFGIFWHIKLTIVDFFRQCLFLQHDPARQLVSQDWSLGVELKGSALLPLFVICARRKYVALIIPMAASLLFFVGTGHYYVTFIIGVLLAQYDTYWIGRLARFGKWAKRLLFIGGLLLYQGYEMANKIFDGSDSANKYGWLVTTFGCATILLCAFSSQRMQRMLNYRPVVFLGRISYSVYLLQLITILCLLPPLVAGLNQLGIIQPPILFPVTVLTSVAVTIGLAAIMYRFVELPVINFSHRLTKKIQQRYQ
jgi:peptidoglycan/LPS O-acetylase OafA/YrhL